jgi:hypothetical protein
MLPVAENDGLQVSVQPLMNAKSQKPPLADAGTRGPRDSRNPGLADPGTRGPRDKWEDTIPVHHRRTIGLETIIAR